MKNLNVILVLPALLTAGCAGYNHALFMTKSNSGLDIDTKPPTAEITISRKEAVIAPTFEGGQTPPVLASFKPKSEVGGSFKNFFLGVDQTFAGGDAAYAMAKLYNRQDTPPDHKHFDSTLHLSKPPKYKDWLRRAGQAEEARPFIFGTDTMLGLKIAWSGVGGQFPDSVKAGFNRKEFAWAPIFATNAIQGEVGTNVKMPAFLATIESHIAAGGTNRIEALQYFATGEAATLLTMRPEVRAAMLARLDPNEDEIGGQFSERGLQIISPTLFGMYQALDKLDQQGDAVAGAYLQRLNALTGTAIPPNYRAKSLHFFVFDSSQSPPVLREDSANPAFGSDFNAHIGYLENVDASYTSLLRALDLINQQQALKIKKGSAALADVAPSDAAHIAEQAARHETERTRFRNALSRNADVNGAYSYFQSLLNSR